MNPVVVFICFDPVKGCAILDFKPKSLGGGQLVVAPTDGGAFRFQVFDEQGKVIIHNLVVPSSQSAITFQANTIQLDSTTLKLPNSGAKITKTQAKSYKVWIATLEASFHEAMKSGGMESLLKEIVYTLWQCHKMHNWAFPAKRMVKDTSVRRSSSIHLIKNYGLFWLVYVTRTRLPN